MSPDQIPAVLACPNHAILKGVLFKNRLKRYLQIPPTQQFLCSEQIGSTAVYFSDLWSEVCSLGATYLNTPFCFPIRDERGWEDNITWKMTKIISPPRGFIWTDSDMFFFYTIAVLCFCNAIISALGTLGATAAQLQTCNCLSLLTYNFVCSSPLSHASWLWSPWQIKHILVSDRRRIS